MHKTPPLLLEAHVALGYTLYYLGEFVPAREHAEQGLALYDPPQHRALAVLYGGADPGMYCLSFGAWALWMLGYPDQALRRNREALTLAQELSQPLSLAYALACSAIFHPFRRERQVAQERAEAAITLSTEQGIPQFLAFGTVIRGWALAEQGQVEEGIAQLHQGLAASQAPGWVLLRPYWLALLAEAYGKVGQAGEGLTVLAEALALVDKNGERWYEAELYRLKGELTLQKFQVSGSKFQVQNSPASEVRSPESEAEECFLRALDIARKQQAKSLELRAATSLARLWHQQGKEAEARGLLAPVYNWFTEGFDTKDLQKAKALLDSLGFSV